MEKLNKFNVTVKRILLTIICIIIIGEYRPTCENTTNSRQALFGHSSIFVLIFLV